MPVHPPPPSANEPFERRREQLLPRYGMLYFDQLSAEFKIFDSSRLNEHTLQSLEAIVAKRESGKALSWDDLYVFDLALSRCLAADKLSQKVLALRARYGDVAGARQFALYMATNPPDPAAAPEESVRADLEHLMGELYFRYAIDPLREKERAIVSVRVAKILGLAVAVIVATSVAARPGATQAPIAATVMFAGAIGGVVSMQQRYYSWTHDTDPMHNVSQLVQGWSSILLSMTGGAVFSLILYLALSARLVEGSIFPQFPETESSFGLGLGHVLVGPDLLGAEYAKLLVWGFIAGFAERFVPDTLSRFVEGKGNASTLT